MLEASATPIIPAQRALPLSRHHQHANLFSGFRLSLDLFDFFIGLLQALIFTLLTIIYFGFAAGPDEDTQL
jgi:F0F1-type ATP synthase membrane subunit a